MGNVKLSGNMVLARQRRGATAVQVAVVLGLVTMTAIFGITQIGSLSNSQLTQTAGDVGNPGNLTGRFGNSAASSSGGSTSGGSSGGSSDGSSGGEGGSGSSMCP